MSLIVLECPLRVLVMRTFALRGFKTTSCWRAQTELTECINMDVVYQQRLTILLIPRKILTPKRGNTF